MAQDKWAPRAFLLQRIVSSVARSSQKHTRVVIPKRSECMLTGRHASEHFVQKFASQGTQLHPVHLPRTRRQCCNFPGETVARTLIGAFAAKQDAHCIAAELWQGENTFAPSYSSLSLATFPSVHFGGAFNDSRRVSTEGSSLHRLMSDSQKVRSRHVPPICYARARDGALPRAHERPEVLLRTKCWAGSTLNVDRGD